MLWIDDILVFVPLARMPLNPNGKIDKPALPFPDTVAAASSSTTTLAPGGQVLTPTERTIHEIWSRLLPSPPAEIPLDESFFDLGGHSILATRLIFELRNSLAVGAPLGLVFDFPTIKSLAKELDDSRDSDLGLATGEARKSAALPQEDNEYSLDADVLTKELRAQYEKPQVSTGPRVAFLTGATGFLGAFILRDLLLRTESVSKVICHVRAKSVEAAMSRLRESGEGRGAWDENWVAEGRVEVVVGDLNLTKLGMTEEEWVRVAREAGVIVHNGALVCIILPLHRYCITDAERGGIIYRFIGCILIPNFEQLMLWQRCV
jgi:L-aminoadipate-semialdehyde dehydrogenase